MRLTISSSGTSNSSTKSTTTPGILHGLRLGNGTGEAVQQEAVGAIRLRDTFFDQADDDVVGDELTCVHHGLGLEAQLGARLDRRTQHVAGGDLQEYRVFP